MKFLPLYNKKFEELHESFADALKTQGFSRGGEAAHHVKEFLFYLENRGVANIKAIKATHIVGYFGYLRERPNLRRGGKLSDASIRTHLHPMRLFFDYLLNTGHIQSSPARLPKFTMGGNREMSVLTVDEVMQLYAACKNQFERALLSLAYGCGMRRSEIVNLNVSDVLFGKGMVNIRKGKGNKFRCVPVTDKVMGYLREFVVYERDKRVRPQVNSPSFFLNKWGKRYGGLTLNLFLQQVVKRTGDSKMMSKQVTLHTLRRSIATHLMDNGADMHYVRNFLGHEMLDTTHLYSKRRKQRIQI
jgi:integrase/recombinase XerD